MDAPWGSMGLVDVHIIYSDLTRPHLKKVAKRKGNARLFQGNRSVGEILFHLARLYVYIPTWDG